jgi:hypothetical protein
VLEALEDEATSRHLISLADDGLVKQLMVTRALDKTDAAVSLVDRTRRMGRGTPAIIVLKGGCRSGHGKPPVSIV